MNTPMTDALVARHTAETAALPMNPPREVMLEHARRQALELLAHAKAMELSARSETAPSQGEPVAWRWRIKSDEPLPWLYATNAQTNLSNGFDWEVEPLYGSAPSATRLNVPKECPPGAIEVWIKTEKANGTFSDCYRAMMAYCAEAK